MPLTREQLTTVVRQTFSGATLHGTRQLDIDHYALELSTGDRVSLMLFDAPRDVLNAAAALRALRGEIDLPLPALHAVEPTSTLAGRPFLLTSQVVGEQLSAVLPRMTDEQLYAVGRTIGEIASRVHRLSVERYGNLADADDQADDERTYGLQRVERFLALAAQLDIIDTPAAGDEVRQWFVQHFQPVNGRPATLLHGNLGPDTILLSLSPSGWRVSGIVGWKSALGWSPAWEHVVFLQTTNVPRYFGFRVGYGNGYDEQTRRMYEQVREHMLAPYRMLLLLQQMCVSMQAGNGEESQRYRSLLFNRVRALAPR